LPTPRIAKSITYFNGYIWVLNCEFLTKINYTINAIEAQYTLPDHNTADMKGDGDILWITNIYLGKVYTFNITSGIVQNILPVQGELKRPLGIEIDENYVYIAENYDYGYSSGGTGTIAVFNKSDLSSFTRINVIVYNTGPYSLYKDSYGCLWYTTDHVIGIVGGINWGPWTPNANPPPGVNYFMTEVPTHSPEIWFSGVGSAYIGMKDIGTLGNTDINKDGKVDIKDVSYVSKWFGSLVSPAPENADLNSDGKIDIKDVSAVSRNFGKTL
jgi:hypothetical protein